MNYWPYGLPYKVAGPVNTPNHMANSSLLQLDKIHEI